MDQLAINEKVGAYYMLLELSGAVNAYTITELKTKVYSYILDSNVVLDMSQVSQLDSTGLGVIIAAHNDGEGCGTKIFILNPSNEARHSLEKTRWRIPFASHLLEIDLYPFWRDQAILEVELQSEEEDFLLPPEIRVIREVTGDPRYLNSSLARELP